MNYASIKRDRMKLKFNLDRRKKWIRRIWWNFKDIVKDIFRGRCSECCAQCKWLDEERAKR